MDNEQYGIYSLPIASLPLLPLLLNVQESDTTADATTTKAGNKEYV